MPSVTRFLILAGMLIGGLSIGAFAQTSTVIPDTEAGVVVKVFMSKNGNTFLNFGASYPAQTFTGWIPADRPLASDPTIQSLQGKRVKVTGTIQLYRGKPEIKVLSRDQITEE